MEKEPVVCLVIATIFFLLRDIEVTVDILLSQRDSKLLGIVLYLFFIPLLNTVTLPMLFLPALFFKNTLKCLFILQYFIKNVDFLKRCVGVVGLCFLVKIYLYKH